MTRARSFACLVVSCHISLAVGAFLKSDAGQAPIVQNFGAMAPAPASAWMASPSPFASSPPAVAGPADGNMEGAMGRIRQVYEEEKARHIADIRNSLQNWQSMTNIEMVTYDDARIYNQQITNLTQSNEVELQHMADGFNEEAQQLLDQVGTRAHEAAANAVVNAVNQVEAQAENNTVALVRQAEDMQAEAMNISDKAARAADISTQAATAAEGWLNSLPQSQVTEAEMLAKAAQQAALNTRDAAAETKRVAKLTGNMAQHAFLMVKEAEQRTAHAQETALKAVEQAHENAKLLASIKQEAEKARQAAIERTMTQVTGALGPAAAPAAAA